MVQSRIVFPNGNEDLGETPAFQRSIKHFLATVILSSFTFLTPLAVSAEEAKAPEAPPAATAPAPSATAPAALQPLSRSLPFPAATPPDVKPVLNTGDTAWMLVSSALVLLMIPGRRTSGTAAWSAIERALSTMMHTTLRVRLQYVISFPEV